uniref:EGF-like domain-containing protein n=1 Tax=Elaeophora elaphi TaxID=1147741 RepID=A0A158Q748_9BILA
MNRRLYETHNPIIMPGISHCVQISGLHTKFLQCRKVCGERLAPNIACDRCDIRFIKNAGGKCVDLDECRNGDALCDRSAWYENTVNSHRCKCNIGYVGNGKKCTYVGVGRATTDCTKCSKHATCMRSICTCNIGFKGDGLNCTDVDECSSRPSVCHHRAKCRNIEGSYLCECQAGYAGNGYNCNTCKVLCEMTNALDRKKICWDFLDVGRLNRCRNGTWEQRFYFNKATTKCEMFWFGGCSPHSLNIFKDLRTCQRICEHLHLSVPESDPCSGNPCKNSGTCVVKDKIAYQCSCDLGFSGIHCETKFVGLFVVGPCDVNPCLNNGTCMTTSSYSTFFCDCPPKFGGQFCNTGNQEKFHRKFTQKPLRTGFNIILFIIRRYDSFMIRILLPFSTAKEERVLG